MFKRPAGAPPADLDVGLIEGAAPGSAADADAALIESLAQGHDDASPVAVDWGRRAMEVRAENLDPAAGRELFEALWGEDRHFAKLSSADLGRMSRYLQFVRVPPAQEVIRQNEVGDFLVLVLDGRLTVEKLGVDEERTRIGQARAGDMLGEMSLLDGGPRFSSCVTQNETRLAVLDGARLDAMMDEEPALALVLLASLSRRLSLRLRQVSTRLNALLARG